MPGATVSPEVRLFWRPSLRAFGVRDAGVHFDIQAYYVYFNAWGYFERAGGEDEEHFFSLVFQYLF